MTERKAEETFRYDLTDVEVQMLSKICTPVKKHIKNQERNSQAKKVDNSLELDTPKVKPDDYRRWHEA